MKKVKFTEQELASIKLHLESNGVPAEIIAQAMEQLSPAPKVKLPMGDKGIKIALKRKANKLGVNYIIDIKGKVVTLSSFTGNSLDAAILNEIAAKNEYTVETQ